MILKTSSVFFSKDHFRHPDYLIKNRKKIEIPARELQKIKKISGIVACFTFGIGGLLCYYIWTASRKVTLFKMNSKFGPTGIKLEELAKNRIPLEKRTDALNILPVAEKSKDTALLIKELRSQIEADPGYHPDCKDLAKLHASLMSAPENSYCIIPHENNEFRVLYKQKFNDDFFVNIINFKLNPEGFFSPQISKVVNNLDEQLKLMGLGERYPLKVIKDHAMQIPPKLVDIEMLKKQIEEDPGFSKIYQTTLNKSGTYSISAVPKHIDARENLYCLTMQISPGTSRTTLFWLTDQGIMEHINKSHKNSEEAILFKTPPQYPMSLKELLQQNKAGTPFTA